MREQMCTCEDRERELRRLIRQLLLLWREDWDRVDYTVDILPKLMDGRERPTGKEHALLKRIQVIATPEEWRSLHDQPDRARGEMALLRVALEVQPELERLLKLFQLTRADALFGEDRDALDPEWYEALRRARIADRRDTTIRYWLARGDYARALEETRVAQEVLRADESCALETWCLDEIHRSAEAVLQQRVLPLLELYAYEEAQTTYSPLREYLGERRYATLEAGFRAQELAERSAKEIAELLARYSFREAQDAFRRSAGITREGFTRMMGRQVEAYFNHVVGFEIDKQKGRALSTVSPRTLVEARAGSGKTSLIACFVRMLTEKFGVASDEILVVAFNRRAAAEIGERVREDLGVGAFRNARTFHSLAWHIVPAEKRRHVLMDSREEEVWEASREKFLTECWEELTHLHPLLLLRAFLILRGEAAPRESELVPGSREYYLYRRNECQTSLNGEAVKSRGEKYIADFLFEHGLPYAYERNYYWGTEDGSPQLYHPDFTIFSERGEVVVEHWALDPDDPTATVPDHWLKDTEQYRKEISRKKLFWHNRSTLIETHAAQVARLGRVGFESRLKGLLEGNGILCKRLPQEKLNAKVQHHRLKWLILQFGNLITRAKKASLSPDQVRQLYSERSLDRRTRRFGRIAWRMYEAYEKRMLEHGVTDYDSLLREAALAVTEHSGQFLVDDFTRGAFALDRLRWLFVDEFQDYSALFDALVHAIADRSADLRVVCVGDSWQAINAFAGSELRFIEEYETLYPAGQAARLQLPVNRRSRHDIVACGNRFMRWAKGRPAEAVKGSLGGRVDEAYVDDVSLNLAEGSPDERYLLRRTPSAKEVDVLTSKYLKLVVETIQNQPGRTYSILARTNKLSASLGLGAFANHVFACLDKDARKRVQVSTVHRYKGRESDVTIVLRVIQRQFPLIHPDSALYSPLGETIAEVIDEERRLFYVAISRARDELVLVTERGRRSEFLDDLGLRG